MDGHAMTNPSWFSAHFRLRLFAAIICPKRSHALSYGCAGIPRPAWLFSLPGLPDTPRLCFCAGSLVVLMQCRMAVFVSEKG
jgi:hypothetical protein